MVDRLADSDFLLLHFKPDAQFDPYEPMVEFFTGKGKEMTMPLSGKPERTWQ